jgi:hypothetical protein
LTGPLEASGDVSHVLESPLGRSERVNSWIKRVIGAAVLGGGLLALGSGAASAEPASVEVSAAAGDGQRIGVRLCGGGAVLSGLLGRCGGQGGSDSADAQAGDGRAGVRARVPGLASAEVAAARRSSRPRAALSARLNLAPRNAAASAAADSSPSGEAAASADPAGRLERLLDLRLRRLESRLAGIGLLQSGSFDLAGDLASLTPVSDTPPASDDTPPPRSEFLQRLSEPVEAVGDLMPTLAGLPGLVDLLPAPEGPAVEPPEPGEAAPGLAGIGVVETGELASGNQAEADVGPVSASAPVDVCGNGVGAFGDASASCGGSQAGSGQSSGGSSGSASAASAAAPVHVCGNSVGAFGDASASCGGGQADSGGQSSSGSAGASTGSAGASASTGDGLPDGTASGNRASASVDGMSAFAPFAVCGNGVGLLGGASASCGEDTGGATPAPSPSPSPAPSPSPSPAPAPGPGQGGTDPAGLVPGLAGLTGSAGSSVAFAPLRAGVAGAQAGTLPFTGGASDLLMVVAMALLAAGALLLRAGAARSHLQERR